ncbi:hypothetical protein F4778DRAFT_758057 [Xylariomycetidae sp. FL2044]|nr:hypothetical protein F4778DRAFT_758057 [Xylariomycetidae sp. FL2044]
MIFIIPLLALVCPFYLSITGALPVHSQLPPVDPVHMLRTESNGTFTNYAYITARNIVNTQTKSLISRKGVSGRNAAAICASGGCNGNLSTGQIVGISLGLFAAAVFGGVLGWLQWIR